MTTATIAASRASNPIDAINWKALKWGLRLLDPKDPGDIRFIELWSRAGSLTDSATTNCKLQGFVIDKSIKLPWKNRSMVVTEALLETLAQKTRTGATVKRAAMQVVRALSLAEREELRKVLVTSGPVAVRGRLNQDKLGSASLIIYLAEALDMLMIEVEERIYGPEKERLGYHA